MLLSPSRCVVSALSVSALAFVAGLGAGFAAPGVCFAWPWLAGSAVWGAAVCYGWRIPCPGAVFALLAGCALAMRTESALAEVKRRAWMRPPGGGAPAWRLEVEGGVNVRSARGGDVAWVQFMSHVGPQSVRATMPIARGSAAPVVGEVWECRGWLSMPRKETRRGVPAPLWIADADAAHRIAAAEGWRSWRRLLRDLGAGFSRRAGIGLSCCPEAAALNRAMLLGRRAGISSARKESFAASGTVHVFAISGMHVMLMAHLLEMLLKAACVPGRARGALVTALVAAYALLTGARASAVRAALMASLYYSALCFGRRPDSLAAWSLAAFTVYGLSPERFFDAGCALSFTVMLGVVVWLKWTLGVSPPESARRLAETPPFQSLRKRLGWLFDGYGVSCAAWVAGAPVAARLFGLFTWGGLVANILAVKFAAAAVALCLMGVVASFASDILAAYFNLLAAASTSALVAVASFVGALPDVSLRTAPWSILECAAWYGAAMLALMCLERVLPRRNDISGEWWTS